jgi:hypothetical protein
MIQTLRPSLSTADTQPTLNPALIILLTARAIRTYREIPEIVAELRSLEQEATKITKELDGILHLLNQA